MKHIKVILAVAHIIVLTTVLIVLAACGEGGTPAPSATTPPATTETASAKLELTIDELAQYNGKDGNPAYIAVDGVIYDVSDVPQWKDGEHNGFSAGNDLTEEIKTISPHGVSKLQGLPVVGTLNP